MIARYVRVRILLVAALVAMAAPAEQGRKQLFNGKDMTDWQHVGKGSFSVEDGALKAAGGMGLLYYTAEKFGNAIIRVVYKSSDPSANSGVFIRIPEQPQDAWFPVHHGYEVQIYDIGDEFHRTGAIYSLSGAGTFSPSRSGWNTMEIRLEGQKTVVSVNGKVVNSFDSAQPVPPRKEYYEPRRGPRPDSGYIGLQNHDEKSAVWFKEVSVVPLEK